MNVTCRKCGASVAEEKAYCTNCGATMAQPVRQEEDSLDLAATVIGRRPHVPQPPAQNRDTREARPSSSDATTLPATHDAQTPTTPARKSRTPVIVGAIVLVALILALLTVLTLLS